MQDAIVIGFFVLVLIALAVASYWVGPEERIPADPWTAPWAA